jgi:hypothetical protein
MSKRFQLTPEQLALSEQRKAKLSENSTPSKFDETNSRILSRKWVQLPIAPGLDVGRRVKVLTWNVSTIQFALHTTRLVICTSTAPCTMSCS